MKKLLLLLCLLLLLPGCAQDPQPEATTEAPTVAATLPDGDPHTVACKGSYTGEPDPDVIVAQVRDADLTNGELQIWYWAEVAQYRQSQAEPAPDFSKPLDTQECPLYDSPASWQQYFLQAALNRWHTAQALDLHSRETPRPLEEAYRPDEKTLHKYLDGMPATSVLYGYDTSYRVNTLHQSWLDTLDETVADLAASSGYADTEAMAREAFGSTEDALLRYAEALNRGYMYFTQLTYDLEAEAPVPGETVSDPRVSIRQILLQPAAEETIQDCQTRAEELLQEWMDQRAPTADTFAQLASQYSQDPGSAPSGGLYRHLRREQLPEDLAAWCFDESRQEGDTTILPTDRGIHILLFLSREDASVLDQQLACERSEQKTLLSQILAGYPMDVTYDAIVLAQADGSISSSDLLYPDIAHQRFPEVPLYLQQSYPGTMYGHYKITTNGCGITSLAMIASYLTDEELTPPEMCAIYGRYSSKTGTSGSLFVDAPPQLGFYLVKKSYDWREARTYMEQGHQVVVVQHKGYWTRGGHYLVLEELSEDGMVRVRDSNMYNYAKLHRHKDDLFPWDTLSSGGKGYWIYAKKVTSTAACTRCGDPDSLTSPIVSDYLCEKCETALLRRNTYLQ